MVSFETNIDYKPPPLEKRGKEYKVWTSFGIAMEFLPYLPTSEQVRLQNLNQFWYKIAVSRV